ncbi:radical SAM protein [Candidatus Woesearchaeota archaeon]|nr:radical SAM protein [Candidatus Woesearchaeota archaeon]
MEAYIVGIFPISRQVHGLVFCGSNFKYAFSPTPMYLEFSDECRVDLKPIKEELKSIVPYTKEIVFTGGEPCIQRQALLSLLGFVKRFNARVGIETNGSKPEVLNYLVQQKLIDRIRLILNSPFEAPFFQRINNVETFFTPLEETMAKVRKSLLLLHAIHDRFTLEVKTSIVPGLLYRKEDLLKIASGIDGMHCTWILEAFQPTKVMPLRMQKIRAPSFTFMQHLRASCLIKYPNLRIKIIKKRS